MPTEPLPPVQSGVSTPAPYRDPSSPHASVAGSPAGPPATWWRARRTWAVVATACGAALVVRVLVHGVRPSAGDAPPELLSSVRVFPIAELDLGPATPLAPLLAADAPEQLAVLSPSEGAVALARGEPLTVRFNRPMVDSSRVANRVPDGENPLVFDPPVAGTARWTSRSSLTFMPEPTAWEHAREVHITFAPNVRSLAGETLEDETPRTLVFDTTVRLVADRITHRVMPGEPLRLPFEGPVDLAGLRGELMAFEIGGGRRSMSFGLRASGHDDSGHAMVDVQLARALEPGARIALVVAPMLAGEQDTSSPESYEFEFAPRPQIEGIACPDHVSAGSDCEFQGAPGRVVDIAETLRLYASVPLAPSATSAVSIAPALRGANVTVAGNVLAIRGDWEPGQVYEVRLGDLRDTEGHALVHAAPLAVRSAGLAPQIVLASPRRVAAYESDAPATVRFAGVHVDHGEVRYQPVPAGREFDAVLAAGTGVLPAQPVAPQVAQPVAALLPTARANRWARGAFAWQDPTANRASDMAMVQFVADASENATATPVTTLVQRSDLAISTRMLAQGVLVWVTTVSGASPVAGAEVSVVDGAGVPLGHVASDAQGLAWLPFLATRGAPTTLAVRAVHGSERAVLLLDARTAIGAAQLGLAQGDAAPAVGAPVASVVTDRGAYRPGETVRAKVVVRTVDGERLHAVTQGEVRVRRTALTDADTGIAPTDTRARLGAFGTADVEFVLSRTASIGEHRLEVYRDGTSAPIGVGTITVADFRQPTFRVDVETPATDTCEGEALAAHIDAAYLFGAPASRAHARWSLVRQGVADVPVRWSTYEFGAVDAAAPSGTMDSGEATLDEHGVAAVTAHVALGVPVRQRALLEVEVSDASGQATAARRPLVLYPATYEIGVHRGATWVAGGTALDVDAVVITHDGTPAAGRDVEARIVREGWHTYWEWNGHGGDDAAGASGAFQARRTHDEQLVAHCALRSATDAVHCPFTPTRPGTYRLEATTRDEHGRTSTASRRVYVAAPTEHPDRDPAGAPITLTPTSRAVFVGQSASVTFESPWADAEALLTVEREGVVYTERRRVAAGGNTFSFGVSPAMVPNVFVSLTLARPRATPAPTDGQALDLGAPDLRLGSTELTVRPQSAPLFVDLAVPSGTMRPGDEVAVDVGVHDADHRGVRAELVLYAVDEGTLRLTGYQAPDPTTGLYPRRAPSIAIEDLRRTLVSRVEPDPLPNPSGDGGDGANRAMRDDRERFDPTPLWQPHLLTDAQGHARATFRLPSRPAEYRIMAVAVDTGMRSGRASTQLVATKPVVVRPAMPRSVVDGDRFEAAAFVHNTTDQPVAAQVDFTVDGTHRATRTVSLAAGGDVRVGEWIDVRGVRPIALRVEAVAAGVSDALDARVPVTVRGRTMRSATVGAVGANGRTLDIAMPAGAVPEGGEVTVAVASHPFIGFEPAVGELTDATFDGAEPLASAVLGLAAYASLATTPAPGRPSAAEVRARGEAMLVRLARLQGTGGGFGTWSADDAPQNYASAWALHAIEAARRAGWNLPHGMRDPAIAYVVQQVHNTAYFDPYGGGDYDALALALRALTEAGRPDAARAASLFEQRDRLTPYGQAQLALALPPSDRRRDALVLAAERRALDAHRPGLAAAGSAAGYDRSARTDAAVLEAAAQIDVGYPQARLLASQLLQLRTGSAGASWGSGHETASALTGLAAYAARFRDGGRVDAHVTLDGAELHAAGHSRDAVWYALPVARLVGGAHHALRVDARAQAFFAVSGRWNVALGPDDDVARGRRVALHRVLETESGAPLAPGAHVRLGELIRVRLFAYDEASSPEGVVIRDPLGGGFEAVDDGLETTPRGSLDAILGGGADDEQAIDPRGFYAQRSLDIVRQRAFAPGLATLMLDRYGSTLQEFTFAVRATTVGSFVLPPAELGAVYDADYVARSAVQSITVDP